MRKSGLAVIIPTVFVASSAVVATLIGSAQEPSRAASNTLQPPTGQAFPTRGTSGNSSHWNRYHDPQLSLRFPSGWHVGPRMMGGSFSIPLFSVSKQPVGKTCKTTHVKGGSVTQCGLPFRSLRRGGIFLTWWAAGSIHGRLSNLPAGRRLTVDGRPASLKIEAAAPGLRRYNVLIEHGHPVNIQAFGPPSGPLVRAQKQVAVTVKRTAANNWYVMTAYVRGPHFRRSLRQIMTVVHSTHFTHG
jgi:hypothetical protein